ncbi:MAG: hypothetical protein HOV80_13615 [Polyangiaceae bacterium]|nr:hypothetical protein [Polyangiaceae bacterium]
MSGARDHQRIELERAIEDARGILANAGSDPRALVRARKSLVKKLAARAEDARHGAGQLSLSAQRAPTVEACDDGWQRVESIVRVAEASALEATTVARDVDGHAVAKAALAAEAAARAARRIVEERNHAYTFHADPGFSFGEGWYLAAAAVLAGIAIQIEPEKRQTAQVERFLRDAGLSSLVVPHRSRPRANKHLTEIVARGFRPDPLSAQHRVRAAFLGDGPIAQPITDFVDRRLAGAPPKKKVLLWVRYAAHHPGRNTTYAELVELTRCALAEGLVPILIGDAVRGGELPDGAADMTLFWKDALFQGADMRRAQLQFFEHLRKAHALVGQLGVTTAGMDGPALMGLPTMYLTDAPNVRMREWVTAVPGYEEVVRDADRLERIRRTLKRWAEPVDATSR